MLLVVSSLSALGLLSSTNPTPSVSAASTKSPLLAGSKSLRGSNSRRKNSAIASTKVVTRRDYAGIITQKIGGRSNEEIAKNFGLPLEKVRGHIERAMSEYRKGNIKPESGAVVGEAEKKAKDDNTDVVRELSQAYSTTEDLASQIVSKGPEAVNVAQLDLNLPSLISADLSANVGLNSPSSSNPDTGAGSPQANSAAAPQPYRSSPNSTLVA